MRPFHVDTLDDYLSWFEQVLDWTGGVLETSDGALDVQVWDSPPLLIFGKQRLRFMSGAYLDFQVRVNGDLVQTEYNYHFARQDDSLIWRLDKHPLPDSGGAPVTHIHLPPDSDKHIPHDEVDVETVVQKMWDSGELEFQADDAAGDGR